MRAEGIPLYIEELTKSLLASFRLVEQSDRYVLQDTIDAALLPDTLRASLTARLDALGSAKHIAQIAATIGREFEYSLLAQISRIRPEVLEKGLASLLSEGIVLKRGGAGNAVYIFKHALIQDAAYDSLLKTRRQSIHAAIADALIKHCPHITESQPEIVAHHFSEALQIDQAVTHWLKAGKLAATRSASTEAVAHFDKGLQLLLAQPQSSERDKLIGSFERARIPNFIAARSFKALETHQAFERQLKSLPADKPDVQRRGILANLIFGYFNFGQYRKAYETAEELLATACAAEDHVLASSACSASALACNAMGQFSEALQHTERALEYYTAPTKSPNAWRYVWEFGVVANCARGVALWHLGEIVQAETVLRAARKAALESKHANTIGHAFAFGGIIPSIFGHDFAALLNFAQQCEQIGKAHDLPQWQAWGASLAALARTDIEADPKIGLDQFRQGLEFKASIQDKLYDSIFHAAGAFASLKLGRQAEALQFMMNGQKNAKATGERWADTELHRLRGNILAQNDEVEAEASYRAGLRVAEAQGAITLGLRCAISFAQFLQKQSRIEDAYGIVSTHLIKIARGQDVPVVREAEHILRALHGK